MKKYVLPFSVLVLLLADAETPQAQQTTPPTLEDTLKFISEKLSEYGKYETKVTIKNVKQEDGTVSDKVVTSSITQSVKYEKCKITKNFYYVNSSDDS